MHPTVNKQLSLVLILALAALLVLAGSNCRHLIL